MVRRSTEPLRCRVTLGADKRIRPRRVPHRACGKWSGAAHRTDRRHPSADRSTNDRTERISNEPAKAEASGRDLRMGQDGRWDGQDSLPRCGARRRAVRNDHERVQPRPNGSIRTDRDVTDRLKCTFRQANGHDHDQVAVSNCHRLRSTSRNCPSGPARRCPS